MLIIHKTYKLSVSCKCNSWLFFFPSNAQFSKSKSQGIQRNKKPWTIQKKESKLAKKKNVHEEEDIRLNRQRF